MEIDYSPETEGNYCQTDIILRGYDNPKEEEILFKLVIQDLEERNSPHLLGLEDLEHSEDEDAIRARHPGFTVCLNLKSLTGEVKLAACHEWRTVLRYLYFYGFLPRGALLLHAAGVVREGKAYVFPGPSGAGKTTIVNHSAEGRILSDEVILVGLPKDGGPLMAYGTPFFGEWGRPGEKIAAPVKGLYFPKHSSENKILPLMLREVLSRLLPCIFTYTNWQPRLQKVFDLTARLAESVPGYDLHFRPSADFWQVIDAS